MNSMGVMKAIIIFLSVCYVIKGFMYLFPTRTLLDENYHVNVYNIDEVIIDL